MPEKLSTQASQYFINSDAQTQTTVEAELSYCQLGSEQAAPELECLKDSI